MIEVPRSRISSMTLLVSVFVTVSCCSKRFKCVAALNRGLSTSLELTEHRPAMSWSTHWLRLPNDTWPWSVSLRRVTELSSDSCTHVHPRLELLLALRALLLLPSVCDEQKIATCDGCACGARIAGGHRRFPWMVCGASPPWLQCPCSTPPNFDGTVFYEADINQ